MWDDSGRPKRRRGITISLREDSFLGRLLLPLVRRRFAGDAGDPGAGAGAGGGLPERFAAIERYCAEAFPDHYAGLGTAVPQADLVFIFRRPGTDLDTAVRARFPEFTFAFSDARYSRRAIMELMDRIGADTWDLREQGVDIVSFTAGVDGSGLVVHPASDPDHARDVLTRRYGPGIVVADPDGPDRPPGGRPSGPGAPG